MSGLPSPVSLPLDGSLTGADLKFSKLQQLSLKNRAPAPILSLDQLHLAQDTPHSNVTSNSSNFLSPPISDTYSISPPPKPEAEDYLGARIRHRHKGKHRVGRGRKQRKTREDSEETNSSAQFLLKSYSSTCDSPESYCTSCGSVSEVGNIANPANNPLQKRPTFPNQLSSERSLSPTPLRVHHLPARRSEAIPVEKTESPALISLRRLSQTGGRSDNNGFRRLSRTLTSTLGMFRPRLIRAGDQSSNDVEREASTPPVLQSNTETEQTSQNEGHSLKLARNKASNVIDVPELPLTIVLRKASAALVSHTANDNTLKASRDPSDLHKQETIDEPRNYFPELVAFRSTLLVGSDTRSTPFETTTDQENTVTRVSSSSQCRTDKDKLKTLISIDEPKIRPRSDTAGTALTLADIYVAPGTFVVDPKSRRTSIVSGQLSRRLSVVQFRSRNSIHEIIWREDESSSGSCSSKNVSPQDAEPSSRIERISNRVYSSSSNISQADSFRHDGLGEPIVGSYSIGEHLFQWSWGKQLPFTAVQHDDNVSQLLVPESNVRNGSASYLDKEGKRSVSEGDSVVSFPPLLERNCTADWQQHLLVDINDPTTGRTQRSPCLPASQSVHTATTKTNETESRHNDRGTRKYSSRPYAPARTAESGRTGSSIGCSSRQRLLSGAGLNTF